MTLGEMFERARMDAWRLVSPMSNLHDTSCGDNWPCYKAAHYPEGSPLDGDEEDMTANALRFLAGSLR